MSAICNICRHKIDTVFYRSNQENSLTSLGQIYPQETVIYKCETCCHVQTDPLHDIKKYYDQSYKILTNSDEEDQIYMNKKGEKSFRVAHQVKVLTDKIELPENARIIDYGSGKAATLKQLTEKIPTITPCLFDVSEDYVSFWQKFTSPENWSIHKLKPEWENSFDVALSFFALEHVEHPQDFIRKIDGLLKEGGVFYGIVPNMYDNIGDFVVIDHVNHFSEFSLRYLLTEAGFTDIEIDAESHYGAFVFKAKKSVKEEVNYVELMSQKIDVTQEANEIKRFWEGLGKSITAFEEGHAASHKAIYGSGFYGGYIASQLKNIDTVQCFIDQNPHRQGLEFFGKKIIAVEELPKDVETMLVGLNPATAQKSIQDIKHKWASNLNYFFLEAQ